MNDRNEYDPLEHIAESLARIADALETLASTVDDGMATQERYDPSIKTVRYEKVRVSKPYVRTE